MFPHYSRMISFCIASLLLVPHCALRYSRIPAYPATFRRTNGLLPLVPGTKSSLALPRNDNQQFIVPTQLYSSPLEFIRPQIMTAFYVNLPAAAFFLYSNQKSLTRLGLLHATILGVGLWSCLGLHGWGMGVIYFILGSLVTKIKMAEKERLGIAEKRHGARGPENVWGSAATALICAVMCTVSSAAASSRAAQLHSWEVAFVAAWATKLGDTFSSEIGKAFGQRTFLITTLRPVPKGTEGAVSIEGTASGVLGSLLMAGVGYGLGLLRSPLDIAVITGSAFVATTAESYLGAILQQQPPPPQQPPQTMLPAVVVSNEMVNFLMTVIGALLAFTAAQMLNVPPPFAM